MGSTCLHRRRTVMRRQINGDNVTMLLSTKVGAKVRPNGGGITKRHLTHLTLMGACKVGNIATRDPCCTKVRMGGSAMVIDFSQTPV